MTHSGKKRHIAILNNHTLRCIDEKQSLLAQEPDYHLRLRNRIETSLKNIADVSVWCSHADGFKEEFIRELEEKLHRKIDDAALKELAAEEILKLAATWQYLRGAVDYSKRPTDKLISPSLLMHLAESLDSFNNSYRGIDEEAFIFESHYNTPVSAHVPELVEDLCKRIKDSNAHPIDKAAHFHIGIVAIQPYRFAHKRLGRLIQDSILTDHNLPVATIMAGERDLYCDLLRSAVIGYSQRNSLMQVPFYDFIASKVNMQLDEYIDVIFTAKGRPLPESKKEKRFGDRIEKRSPHIHRLQSRVF